MGDLQTIGERCRTDKATYHKFCDFYDSRLGHLRNQSIKFLEIGVLAGASIKMWSEWAPKWDIHGVDIKKVALAGGRPLHILDCDDETKVSEFAKTHNSWDIIVDDGGHTMRQQQVAFNCLFDTVKSGGYFVIEDLHTSFPPYLPKYNKEQIGTTYDMIQALLGVSTFNSPYITQERIEKFRTEIEHIETWSRVPGDLSDSATCIIKKK